MFKKIVLLDLFNLINRRANTLEVYSESLIFQIFIKYQLIE